MQRWMLVLVIGAAFCGIGCGKSGPPRKQVFKVTGKLVVDNEPPMSPIQIECHSLSPLDTKMPTVSLCDADPDGTFQISTYDAGDGVPPGEYVLTFSWRQFNVMSRNYAGPDRLKGKYSKKDGSQFKVTVVDKPVDLGEIALTTKE